MPEEPVSFCAFSKCHDCGPGSTSQLLPKSSFRCTKASPDDPFRVGNYLVSNRKWICVVQTESILMRRWGKDGRDPSNTPPLSLFFLRVRGGPFVRLIERRVTLPRRATPLSTRVFLFFEKKNPRLVSDVTQESGKFDSPSRPSGPVRSTCPTRPARLPRPKCPSHSARPVQIHHHAYRSFRKVHA
ncbi:hypothetical protein BDN67DRAFT_205511 [Paxillus ammoniavirescens]|nr:hypothetical protein BDN67DRAFT_205511 [Paxillus ammoniavirescens]